MSKPAQEYLKEPYARILIPDELGGYSAEILEFPGCFAEGETADEAMQALERAAQSWIQAALDQGQEIPPPSTNQGYSGKVSLRLPRSIHRKVAQFAERDDTSINQFLVSAVAARVGVEEFYQQLVAPLLKRIDEHLSIAANRWSASINFVNLQIDSSSLDQGTIKRLGPGVQLHWLEDIIAETPADIRTMPERIPAHG